MTRHWVLLPEARACFEALLPSFRDLPFLALRYLVEMPSSLDQGRLTIDDATYLLLACDDLYRGSVPGALYILERRLLPSAGDVSPSWHRVILAWCSLLRVYVMDDVRALERVDEALSSGKGQDIELLHLVRGIALRLQRRFDECIAVFESLTAINSPLGLQPRAWLLESLCASGQSLSPEQMLWLTGKSEVNDGRIGIVEAAIYRAWSMSMPFPVGDFDPSQSLSNLSRILPMDRPLYTALLSDVLPEPLKGVAGWECSVCGDQELGSIDLGNLEGRCSYCEAFICSKCATDFRGGAVCPKCLAVTQACQGSADSEAGVQ